MKKDIGQKAKELKKKYDAMGKSIIRQDRWQNSFNGFGGSKDPLSRTRFGSSNVLTHNELDEVYRGDWIMRAIIEALPEDALREEIKLNFEEKEIVTELESWFESANVYSKIEEALCWARLYGGSVIVIGALDGGKMNQPLNMNNIKDISYLTVLDRHQIYPKRYYGNINSSKYSLPEIYSLQPLNYCTGGNGNGGEFNKEVHESRVIRFDGARLPDRVKQSNQGWDDSIVISIYDQISLFQTVNQSGSAFSQDLVTKTLKIPDLADLIASGNEGALQTRVQYALSNMSNLGLVLIGENETLEKTNTPITGFSDLFDRYVDAASAASKIPKTRLFGQSLGTLAGADETTRTYYDSVKNYQKSKVRNQIERLIKIKLSCKNFITKGIEPKNWSFEFNNLWQMTDNEEATLRATVASTDALYIDRGVLSAEEVRSSRFSENGYSIETNIDSSLFSEMEEVENDLTIE